MSILEVYSSQSKPVISCSLIDDNGNEKEILVISLEDNGVHVYKNIEEKDNHYILPPIPQIDLLIKEVIDEVAEELNVKSIVFKFGNDEEVEEQTDNLVLSEEWYNAEKLALAASKHTALLSDIDSKIIIGIVKFSNFLYAATILRKEDTFPLMQVILKTDSEIPIVKIYNEIGQLIQERREKIDNFENYVRSLVNSDEVAIVYKESLEEIPSPTEVTTEKGNKLYVCVIFKYFIGFLSSSTTKDKEILIRNKKKLAKTLRALLYLDRISKNGGTEIIIGRKGVPLFQLKEQIKLIKSKAENILHKMYNLNEVNYYGINDNVIEELIKYDEELTDDDLSLGIRVLPVAFIVSASNKQEFDNQINRILNGPTSDGYDILDEYVRRNVSSYFIGYLMSLEEALIIYDDIINEVNNHG
ncbi:hypothetical protein [Acidianus sp. HS-5]|uniref:hypothetical protein n=1 Tax=Acidianus sp. HS-5 TaxID=2886040 RepID=UPI001F25D19C|nr:hypothetical protein [Acidianus sp. HS-5]BDC18351.1 hypothetical protein HS5_12410 [Acidianus sp. HS-5]